MSTNTYQIAFEHATSEITEINAQLEKLTQRKDLIEKLQELLKQVVPQSNLTESHESGQ
jgi:hypothetical protein